MNVATYSTSFYLCLRRRERGAKDLSVRVTDRPPALSAGEIAVLVSATLPRSLFQRPQLRASITVPPEKVAPPVVEAEVLANIGKIVNQQTGLDLTITVEAP